MVQEYLERECVLLMSEIITTTDQVGAIVRRTRRSQGLTQAELAGACGTSVRFIVEIEKGKPTCQVGKVLKVLRMLGVIVTIAEQRTE